MLAADTGVARAAWLGARPAGGGGRPPGFLCLITTLVVSATCYRDNCPGFILACLLMQFVKDSKLEF